MAPLALPHCLDWPFWHYQFASSWYLHRPESQQLSLIKVFYRQSDSGTLGTDNKKFRFKEFSSLLKGTFSWGHALISLCLLALNGREPLTIASMDFCNLVLGTLTSYKSPYYFNSIILISLQRLQLEESLRSAHCTSLALGKPLELLLLKASSDLSGLWEVHPHPHPHLFLWSFISSFLWSFLPAFVQNECSLNQARLEGLCMDDFAF